jgi:hypothetical protein
MSVIPAANQEWLVRFRQDRPLIERRVVAGLAMEGDAPGWLSALDTSMGRAIKSPVSMAKTSYLDDDFGWVVRQIAHDVPGPRRVRRCLSAYQRAFQRGMGESGKPFIGWVDGEV